MNAKEAMMALLDGKIVTGFNTKWKLNDLGELVVKGIDDWNPSGNDLNYIIDVVEEYPLTFKEALKAMIDGKTVESENSKHKYFLADACGVTFAEVTEDEPRGRILITTIKVPEQVGKWKVVE